MATAKKTAAPLPRRTTSPTDVAKPEPQDADAAEIIEGQGPVKIVLTGSDAAKAELEMEVEMVTVIVPKAYTLTLDDGRVLLVPAGIQEMSVDNAAHWFSKAQGVTVYTRG